MSVRTIVVVDYTSTSKMYLNPDDTILCSHLIIKLSELNTPFFPVYVRDAINVFIRSDCDRLVLLVKFCCNKNPFEKQYEDRNAESCGPASGPCEANLKSDSIQKQSHCLYCLRYMRQHYRF